MKIKDIKTFEANFLDGDSIDDCGKATFSVAGVIDVVDFFLDKQKEEIKEKANAYDEDGEPVKIYWS